jgi:hypothetical protein
MSYSKDSAMKSEEQKKMEGAIRDAIIAWDNVDPKVQTVWPQEQGGRFPAIAIIATKLFDERK